MYGYQSSYPEDIQHVKKVQKFADEFEKYSYIQQPIDLDEEDPDEEVGVLNKPVAPSDAMYGGKLATQQAEPINLYETKKGMQDLFEEPKSE